MTNGPDRTDLIIDPSYAVHRARPTTKYLAYRHSCSCQMQELDHTVCEPIHYPSASDNLIQTKLLVKQFCFHYFNDLFYIFTMPYNYNSLPQKQLDLVYRPNTQCINVLMHTHTHTCRSDQYFSGIPVHGWVPFKSSKRVLSRFST
jgi:hypothetical protein